MHHAGTEGEDDGGGTGVAEGDEVVGEAGGGRAAVVREAGQPDLREPVGLWRPEPVGEHADDAIGGEPPLEDAADGQKAERIAQGVELLAQKQLSSAVDRAPVKSPDRARGPAGQGKAAGHDGWG